MLLAERLKNTLWRTLMALFPTFARPDDGYAQATLNPTEYTLYAAMDVRDRDHACAVARRLLARDPGAPAELRRAALLHDVGKTESRYNPWVRILVALYTPPGIAPAPRRTGLAGAWQLKRHHDRYGAAQLVAAGGDARVAELVARHHRPGSDVQAAQLRDADARF